MNRLNEYETQDILRKSTHKQFKDTLVFILCLFDKHKSISKHRNNLSIIKCDVEI